MIPFSLFIPSVYAHSTEKNHEKLLFTAQHLPELLCHLHRLLILLLVHLPAVQDLLNLFLRIPLNPCRNCMNLCIII